MSGKRRKSYITIAIILCLVIIVIVTLAILYFNRVRKVKIVEESKEDYPTAFKDEDTMKYEYTKLNEELNNLRAFGIVGNNIVGVKDTGDIVNITSTDGTNNYDYVYNDKKIYIVNKETGKIDIIPLNMGEYNIENTIELNTNVDRIQIYNNELYYLSNGTIYNYDKNNEIIFENVEINDFVIKLDNLYVVKNKELIKENILTKEETVIASNVQSINYYNYYEKNKIVFETSIDGQNAFKNVLDVYTDKITNSVNNNCYFVVYGVSEYIYLNNDKNKVFLIEKNGNNKLIYETEEKIQNVTFLKNDHIIVKTESKNELVNIITKNIDGSIETNIDNIKYIK